MGGKLTLRKMRRNLLVGVGVVAVLGGGALIPARSVTSVASASASAAPARPGIESAAATVAPVSSPEGDVAGHDNGRTQPDAVPAAPAPPPSTGAPAPAADAPASRAPEGTSPASQVSATSAPATSTPATPTSGATAVETAEVRAASVRSTAAAAPAGYQGKWGLYAPDFPGTLATVDRLQAEVGRPASYVMWYVHWAGPYSTVSLSDLAAVATNGSTPIVTWMSDDPTGATTITDAAIAAGTYDSYVRSVARTLKAFGRPVLLRLDHEMNGNWYGWSPDVNGNTAGSYIAAWRHVHSVFSSVGAANVTFVWSPNVDYTGATPLASLYPGDAYVGMVGVDGYNWGPLDGHTWQTPQQVFGPTLAQVAAITSRPVLLAEVASTSDGGDKAAWITSLFSMLGSDRSITGFVWFDADKETDWQVDSTPQTLAAFEAGLQG
jgi:hypothetical protein